MDSGSQGRAMALPRAFAAAQGAGGMRASRPTVVLYVPHHPGNPHVSGAKNLCRGGFHIRPGCEPGRYRIGPYMEDAPPQWPRPLRWPQGRDLSLPRAFAAPQGAGGMRASRPTVVPYVPHHPGNPHVSGAKKPCRGGFHIRPGCLRRREPGRYRIGPCTGNHNRRSPANNKPSGPYRPEGLRFMKRYKTPCGCPQKAAFALTGTTAGERHPPRRRRGRAGRAGRGARRGSPRRR